MDTLDAISRLNHLRVLELGECETLSHNFTDILTNLKRLERLRLEKVVNLDPDYRMFSLLKDLRHFRSLELINCEVKIGFDEALAHCRNLEEFLLIPLYKTQVRLRSVAILHESIVSRAVFRINWKDELYVSLFCSNQRWECEWQENCVFSQVGTYVQKIEVGMIFLKMRTIFLKNCWNIFCNFFNLVLQNFINFAKIFWKFFANNIFTQEKFS